MKSKIGFLIKLSGIVTVAIFSLLYYFKSISQFLITGA